MKNILKIISCVGFISIPSIPLRAVTLDIWTERAMSFVTEFEGSAYDAVTLDYDCQGLSLGKKQHTVKGNSLKEVFEEAIKKTGRAAFDRLVADEFLDKAPDFNRLVDDSLADAPGLKRRMDLVRSWQELSSNGSWTDLTEGLCRTGAKRESGTKIRLRSPFDSRLPSFLRLPSIVEAQDGLIKRKAGMALQRATCWARETRQGALPSFQEYLFFFDYLIQNGDSFTGNNHLQKVAQTMELGENSATSSVDGLAKQKMIQLKEWLGAGFANMGGGARGHGEYAKGNAIIWMASFENGRITKDQVRLAYVGWLRSMLGNNEWAYAAMNRRGTIAFSGGIVNNKLYSRDFMDRLFSESGELDVSALSEIVCP